MHTHDVVLCGTWKNCLCTFVFCHWHPYTIIQNKNCFPIGGTYLNINLYCIVLVHCIVLTLFCWISEVDSWHLFKMLSMTRWRQPKIIEKFYFVSTQYRCLRVWEVFSNVVSLSYVFCGVRNTNGSIASKLINHFTDIRNNKQFACKKKCIIWTQHSIPFKILCERAVTYSCSAL